MDERRLFGSGRLSGHYGIYVFFGGGGGGGGGVGAVIPYPYHYDTCYP